MSFLRIFDLHGLHIEDHKYLTNTRKIENAFIPSIAYIPLLQHIGKSAKLIVKIGDRVEEGDLIAEADGFFSANVHSPIPGVVTDIKESFIYNGKKSTVVVIKLDGKFSRTGQKEPRFGWRSISSASITNIIKDAGIVGLGGAVFPTHIKLSNQGDKKITHLYINGAECEPFITCDHRLMLERGEDIIEGINVLEKIITPEKIYIGIETNKRDAIKNIKKCAKTNPKIKVITLNAIYPRGDEKLLIKFISGKVIEPNKLPIDVGAIVVNVSTTLAIKEAVINDKPLIDRVVTVTGSGIHNPENLKVKIGTPIKDIIEECGGLKPNIKKVVVGGPMMGFSQVDLDVPISKGCSAIIAIADEYEKFNPNGVCISCGKCITACKFGLMPTILNRLIKNKLFDEAVKDGVLLCKECGACSYTCPAKIPLVQVFKMTKEFARRLK